MSTSQVYPAHAYATLYPRGTAEEDAELDVSLKANGLLDDIILNDDSTEMLVIDGLRRQARCAALGIAPRYTIRKLTDKEVLAFVVAKNTRRNLTPSQRGQIAEKLTNISHGGARRGQELKTAVDNDAPPVSVSEAAKAFGISPDTVKRAKRVRTAAEKPDAPADIAALPEQIKSGKISLNKANKLVIAADPKTKTRKEAKAKKVPSAQTQAKTDAANQHSGFLICADQAAAFTRVPYKGVITDEVIDAARAVVTAWTELLTTLEERKEQGQ